MLQGAGPLVALVQMRGVRVRVRMQAEPSEPAARELVAQEERQEETRQEEEERQEETRLSFLPTVLRNQQRTCGSSSSRKAQGASPYQTS